MGIFAGGKPGEASVRRANLRALEDKRLAFANRMREEGFAPERTLYIQREGGFWGVAADGEWRYLIYGPGPGEDADFGVERFPRGALRVEMKPESVAATGMGGAFGFGTRGAEGFTYRIEKPDGTQIEMTLLSAVGAFCEAGRKNNALLSARRARGDANFVWTFTTGSAREILNLGREWLSLLTE